MYRRNPVNNKIVYVPAAVPASILAGRASRAIEIPAPVRLITHTAPNRAQRRAGIRIAEVENRHTFGLNLTYYVPVAA